MVYHVTKNTTPDDLKKLFDIIRASQKKMTKGKKPVNARKYVGKVKVKGNPVTLQRKLRNEWS